MKCSTWMRVNLHPHPKPLIGQLVPKFGDPLVVDRKAVPAGIVPGIQRQLMDGFGGRTSILEVNRRLKSCWAVLPISIPFGCTWTHNAEDRVELRSEEIDDQYYNLIPSRFPTIDVFARISGGRSAEVAEVESLTNPRLKEKQRLLRGVAAVDVDDPLLQNWNHAPFTYPNPQGTRFFCSEQPALELSQDLQTALAISIAKREAFLSHTQEEPISLEMRVFKRRVRGRFADGTIWNPNLESGECRRLGEQVLAAGFDGLLFRPPERPSGVCASVFRGAALDRTVQADHFKFIWDGERMSEIYSFSSGEAFTPDQLRATKSVFAAQA